MENIKCINNLNRNPHRNVGVLCYVNVNKLYAYVKHYLEL